MRFLIIFLSVVMVAKGQQPEPLRYVALGDSYTIGTGASPSEAWPSVLTTQLNAKGLGIKLVANPARNGYTTEDLIAFELPVLDTARADFVTLLIGVNDWVQGVTKDQFQKNLARILNHVQKKVSFKQRVLLVTIPDFGLTPQGSAYSRGRNISEGITEFNKIIKSEAKKRGLPCADIFEISKKVKKDPSLVAADELHPSAKGYTQWVTVIFPPAFKLLTGN